MTDGYEVAQQFRATLVKLSEAADEAMRSPAVTSADVGIAYMLRWLTGQEVPVNCRAVRLVERALGPGAQVPLADVLDAEAVELAESRVRNEHAEHDTIQSEQYAAADHGPDCGCEP